jgi:hypothetical protein
MRWGEGGEEGSSIVLRKFLAVYRTLFQQFTLLKVIKKKNGSL